MSMTMVTPSKITKNPVFSQENENKPGTQPLTKEKIIAQSLSRSMEEVSSYSTQESVSPPVEANISQVISPYDDVLIEIPHIEDKKDMSLANIEGSLALEESSVTQPSDEVARHIECGTVFSRHPILSATCLPLGGVTIFISAYLCVHTPQIMAIFPGHAYLGIPGLFAGLGMISIPFLISKSQ